MAILAGLAGLIGLMALGWMAVPRKSGPLGNPGATDDRHDVSPASLAHFQFMFDGPEPWTGARGVLWLDAFHVANAGGAMSVPVVEAVGAVPLDYDAEEDQLLIVYDDSAGGPEPDLELTRRAGDPDTTEIRLCGQVLASMPTSRAPPLSGIMLVGESAAAGLDLAG